MYYIHATLVLLSISEALNPTEGFLPKKQQNQQRKPVLETSDPKRIHDDHHYEFPVDREDPHGRLGEWVKTNARHHLPVRHPRTRLDVYVSAGLYQIVDLDQRNNLATVSAYFDVWWNDEYLVWNTSEFEGIDRIFVPVKWIFKPEFYMYHSVVGRVPDFPSDASAEIRSDGKVRMFVSISSKSFCPINFKRFPFDSQTCSFMVSGQNCPVLVLNYEQDDLNDFFLFYTCYK